MQHNNSTTTQRTVYNETKVVGIPDGEGPSAHTHHTITHARTHACVWKAMDMYIWYKYLMARVHRHTQTRTHTHTRTRVWRVMDVYIWYAWEWMSIYGLDVYDWYDYRRAVVHRQTTWRSTLRDLPIIAPHPSLFTFRCMSATPDQAVHTRKCTDTHIHTGKHTCTHTLALISQERK